MDAEHRNAFAELSRLIEESGRRTDNEVRRIGEQLDDIRDDVASLQRAVFGSNPPPANAPAVAKRVTHNEGELAEVAGQVIAVKAEVVDVKNINEVQNKRLTALEKSTKEIHTAVVDIIKDPNVKLAAKLVFAAFIGYATTKGWLHN